MKPFLDENFLLETSTAVKLYHQHAKGLPIIDYHCHLSAEDIANDRQFENLTQIWLEGDHYKWRALRTNGIDEKYITGGGSDYEKFEKWAITVPYTMRNPLYHWTHLELQRYFGIHKLLNGNTAKEIYDEASSKLQTKEYSVKNLIRKMKVEMVGTTDDPIDNLEFHKKLIKDNFEVKVLPSFRPDKVLNITDPQEFSSYISKLNVASGITIKDLDSLKEAIKVRHDYFASVGCKVSDHGLEVFHVAEYEESEVNEILKKALEGKKVTSEESEKYKSSLLYYFAELDHSKGWVQQFHLGPLRNNNTRLLSTLGPDTGFDSIGDFSIGSSMSAFLNKLDTQNKLTKTILYNINPADNELMATMIGNFNDGTIAGKIQYGAAWWFLDQKEGMERQINALSSLGLLSRFVGMLTDSRSYLSYPRHEYFRRILCNLIGNDVENGLLPNEEEWLGQMVENICYYNAKEYFKFGN